MRLPGVKYGDVFKLKLNNGVGLIQCVKEAPKTECEIIRAIPGIYDEEPMREISSIIMKKELFFLQFPVKHAVKQKLLESIGNFPVPSSSAAPRYFRTEHNIGTNFIAWHIIDSETMQIRSVKNLSAEEQKLSEWDIISIPDLAEKIESGWTPEDWL